MEKLLIFDWDGVIFDSLVLVYGAVIQICKISNLKPPSIEDCRKAIYDDWRQFYKKFCPNNKTFDEALKIRNKYMEGHRDEIKLVRGAITLLKNCKKRGIKTAIVSHEKERIITEKTGKFKINSLLDLIRGGAPSSKASAYAETLEYFNIGPKNAFCVDDTNFNLIDAKKIGIWTIGYAGKEGFSSKEKIMAANPDFIVNKLSEIIPIIEKGGNS